MRFFSVKPTKRDYAPLEFAAEDPGQVLNLIHRRGWDAADILEGDTYLFSAALDRNGVWSITKRSSL